MAWSIGWRAFLGEQAQTLGLRSVVLHYVPTRKNAPALAFLQSLDAGETATAEDACFTLTAASAAALRFQPSEATRILDAPPVEGGDASPVSASALDYPQIANELRTPAAILVAIRAEKPQADTQSGFIAPRTELETEVAAQWAELLGAPKVGATDDFFNLGGNSLQGMTFINRIAPPGSGLYIGALFDAPTVRTFAAHLTANFSQVAARLAHLETAPPAMIPQAQNDAPLSFAQYRLWFLEQLHPAMATYNVPYAIDLRGELNIPALQKSLNAIAARHAALRTTFPALDGQPVQRVAPTVTIPLQIEMAADERKRKIGLQNMRVSRSICKSGRFSAPICYRMEQNPTLYFYAYIISSATAGR